MKECARRKQYVEVVATHCIDGSVRPQKIILAAGPVFEIQDSREAAGGKNRATGELARRFVVKIKGKEMNNLVLSVSLQKRNKTTNRLLPHS